jgi:hypothetical protein
MRLIAQARQGYFPAPPEAIAGILKHLRRPVVSDPPKPSPTWKRENAALPLFRRSRVGTLLVDAPRPSRPNPATNAISARTTPHTASFGRARRYR